MIREAYIGSGGGGKGGEGGARTAVEDPDTLQSVQRARILDLLGEGELEGFATPDDPLKSVYLNETPVKSADGTVNFPGAAIQYRLGTQSQTALVGFDEQEAEVVVDVRVMYGTPVVRQITNSDVGFVRVTVSVPSLNSQDTTNGDLHGAEVALQIEVQANGGPYVVQDLQGAGLISGKTRSKYQRAYRVPLTGSAPWNIKVVRLTPESTSSALQNQTRWDSFTEIIPVKLTYPNSAVAGMDLDARQFSSIPGRAYDMFLLRVKVPSNYNPRTRVYTGAWNGTFVVDWTDNPAWAFYDILTSTRYGLGEHIPAGMTDKWALYTIARYCDEMVPDGKGGMEPRFAINCSITSRADAYKVLMDLASVFRGLSYWAGGTVVAVQDAPSDPVLLFNQANVIDGEFFREGSGRKARHSAAVVQWNDPSDFYRLKPEYVEDQAGIARYGYRKTEIVSFGTTSQGQAHRVGKWLLLTERLETETISFKTGLDTSYLAPGQVIKIVDPAKSTVRFGGRILTADTNWVALDQPALIGTGMHTLSITLPDLTVIDRVVSNAPGTHGTIFFAEPLPSTDLTEAMWVLSTPSLEAELARVISVMQDGAAGYKVLCLAHYPGKYDFIENDIQLQLPQTSNLKAAPDAVTNLAGSEYLYKAGGAVNTRLVISFTAAERASTYAVSYRRAGDNWVALPVSGSTHYEVDNVGVGVYDIKVVAYNPLGRPSPNATTSYAVVGKAGQPPADVANFRVVKSQWAATLQWDEVPDLDLRDYSIRTGTDWFTSTEVISGFKGTAYQLGPLAAGTKRFWIVAYDSSNNRSVNPTMLDVVMSGPTAGTLAASVIGEDLRLDWSGFVGEFALDRYEIRYGADWASSAATAKTTKATFDQGPVKFGGTRNYMVAGVDAAGSTGAVASATITINAPAAPAVTAQVIDNNVLLRVSEPASTLPIKHYEIRRGNTFATAEVIGTISARFFVIFESSAGTYRYWAVARDSANNLGAESSAVATVSAPPDYVLFSNIDSTFSGIKTNLTVEAGRLVGPVNTTQTWDDHFGIPGWASPQAQINAGFPIYAQPGVSSGTYSESIDYGAVIAGSNITVSLGSTPVTGTVTVFPIIKVRKLATDPWTEYPGQWAAFAADFRYVAVILQLGTLDGGLIRLDSLNIRLDLKTKSDFGVVDCLSTDSGGTTVNFNADFLDVTSIQVTPQGTTPVTWAVDFADVPNPTSFKVLVFDLSGTRVSATIRWDATGA
jgi:predicted phage tail protein